MDVIYEVRNLSYSYPGSQRQVLSGANLTLGRGEVLSILGPNGAGKSTLLNCMAGLLHPTAGDIELCGKSIHAMKQREIARQVAYVQQNHVPSFSYSVFEFVLMGRAPRWVFGRPGTGTGRPYGGCCRSWASNIWPISPIPRSAAGSASNAPSPGPWHRNPRPFCLMNPPRIWTLAIRLAF